MLRERGERPAILSRGYGRREQTEGVLVVSDGDRVLEPVARSGDEPQMLARSLGGVPILVSVDRYLAGSFAERHFGTTVSLLDDGFQHVQLERDIDLLIVAPRDLQERVIPRGHLREPLEARPVRRRAAGRGGRRRGNAGGAGAGTRQRFSRGASLRGPRGSAEAGGGLRRHRATGALFRRARSLGWDVAREVAFRDHHWFTTRDLATIERAAREAGASAIVTTEKDAARLGPAPFGLPLLVLRMSVEIEPAAVFESWLFERLAHARAGVATSRSSEADDSHARAARRARRGGHGVTAADARRAAVRRRARPARLSRGRIASPDRARKPRRRISRADRRRASRRWPGRCSRTSAACCSSC